MKTIKSKVDNGQISSTAEFQRDFMLMFTNAIMYNNSDQDIFAMTNEMYRDVLEEIEQFMSTQLMVQVWVYFNLFSLFSVFCVIVWPVIVLLLAELKY